MELTKRMNIRYMLIQAVYYAGFCASIGYASVYLLSKGFSNSEIGTLLAVTNVLSVFLQSALASYADSHKNVRLQTIILWCGVITLAEPDVLRPPRFRRASSVPAESDPGQVFLRHVCVCRVAYLHVRGHLISVARLFPAYSIMIGRIASGLRPFPGPSSVDIHQCVHYFPPT